MANTTRYDDDVIAWANEQARFLREGYIDLLDIEHLADEIKDVGRSERELANRMAILLAHLLKWQLQPDRRGASWQITIRNQRRGIMRRINKTPSLKFELKDSDWWIDVWDDATAQVASKAGLSGFPEVCPWPPDQVLAEDWLPE